MSFDFILGVAEAAWNDVVRRGRFGLREIGEDRFVDHEVLASSSRTPSARLPTSHDRPILFFTAFLYRFPQVFNDLFEVIAALHPPATLHGRPHRHRMQPSPSPYPCERAPTHCFTHELAYRRYFPLPLRICSLRRKDLSAMTPRGVYDTPAITPLSS